MYYLSEIRVKTTHLEPHSQKEIFELNEYIAPNMTLFTT